MRSHDISLADLAALDRRLASGQRLSMTEQQRVVGMLRRLMEKDTAITEAMGQVQG